MPDRLTSDDNAVIPGDITIAAIPLDIRWADVRHNLRETERAVRNLVPGTDVAVLPELFTTAFIAAPAIMAEKAEGPDGPTISFLAKLAAETGTALAGSFLCSEKGEYFNRGFFVTPEGNTTYYDKRHLFCLSQEATLCGKGMAEPPAVFYKGVNFGLIICYDLRFPAWCRRRNDYDVLLVPANWPNARAYAWHHLLIARAIENQAIVVGANRAGSDDYGDYDDMTAIYDAMGQPIGLPIDSPADSHPGKSEAIYATVSLPRLRNLRRSLPFLADADSFTISL